MSNFFMPSRSYSLITSGSTSTSAPVLIADYKTLNVSWQSSASLGPSRITLYVSWADGLQNTDDLGGSTSATGWSVYSGINLIGVTPGSASFANVGARWARVSVAPANHSTASLTSVVLQVQSV